MKMDLCEIEAFLHRKIPLTQAMGVGVKSWDAERLVLTAPLTLNHNHLGTAFGGSLAAMATLAGYALVWLELEDKGCHVVIRDCKMSFRKPVRGNISAVCHRPSEGLMEEFKARFLREGKARLALNVTMDGEIPDAVSFEGVYVALS